MKEENIQAEIITLHGDYFIYKSCCFDHLILELYEVSSMMGFRTSVYTSTNCVNGERVFKIDLIGERGVVASGIIEDIHNSEFLTYEKLISEICTE